MHYIIYTDGACSGNPGPGGWAFFVMAEEFPPDEGGDTHEASGCVSDSTANQMEVKAAIEALSWLMDNGYEAAHDTITVHTDSEYLRNGVTEWLPQWKENGWRTSKGRAKNRELWEALDKLLAPTKDGFRKKIVWKWTKGHSDDLYNKKVDKLAVKAYKPLKKEKASGLKKCFMVRVPQKGTKRMTALVDNDGVLVLFNTRSDAEEEAIKRNGDVVEMERS